MKGFGRKILRKATWNIMGVVRKVILKQILDKDNGKPVDWIILARDRGRPKAFEKTARDHYFP
jgi:hypothetical protein